MQRVVVVPYDPAWPGSFEQEREGLGTVLGEGAAIHHVGSTAVAGLAAKPVIDILVVAAHLADVDARNAAMTAFGYRIRGERGIAGRRYFTKGPADEHTHHVHAYERGHPEVAALLALRDYLRAHPADAARYGRLKQRLAQEHPVDITAYMAGKAPLIAELLQRAQKGTPC